MRTAHEADNFRAFVSAMDKRFKDSCEWKEAFLKNQKTQYNGNVLKYVDTLQGLNQKVHLFGFPWRELIVNGLNPEFRNDLAKMQGGKPEEDDALVAAMKEVRLGHERYLQDEKCRTGNLNEKEGGGKKGKKRKQEAEKLNTEQNKKGDGSKNASSQNTGNAKKSKKDSTPAAGTATPWFT